MQTLVRIDPKINLPGPPFTLHKPTRALAHRLDVLVADEASVHLRADDGELPVEVIRRLSVCVGHLQKAD